MSEANPVSPQMQVRNLLMGFIALGAFVHPNTDNELRDHRDCALWLGRSHRLNLRAVDG
jgi:aromatic ring-cleaving dioxygenase